MSNPTAATRPAYRTGADLALAVDHYLALAKAARDSETEREYNRLAAATLRDMWATTAREAGWA